MARSLFATTITGLMIFAVFARADVVLAQQTNAVPKGVGLAFQRAGVVSAVYVRSGTAVRKGQALMQLDASEATALLDQANAELDIQQTKLLQLQTHPETSTVVAIRARNASEALLDIRRSIINILQDGYIKADDAVHNRADQLFASAHSVYPQIILPGIDPTTQDRLAQQRVAVEAVLAQWKTSLDGLTADSDLVAALDAGGRSLSAVSDFLNALASKLNTATPDSANSILTLRNLRSDMYTARINVSTSMKDMLTLRTKEREAENTLALQKTIAAERGSPGGAVALQSALVKQAEARRRLEREHLAQMTLRAPASGVVVSVEASAGATIRVGAPVLHFLRSSSNGK